MDAKKFTLALILMALGLSGCAESATDGDVVDGLGNGSETSEMGIAEYSEMEFAGLVYNETTWIHQLDLLDRYLVIFSNSSGGVDFIIEQNIPEGRPPKVNAHFRFFDAAGNQHESKHVVGVNASLRADFTLPMPDGPAPYILLGDCSCELHVMHPPGDAWMKMGASMFMGYDRPRYIVYWEDVEDIYTKPLLADSMLIPINDTTKYYIEGWNMNLRGDVRWISPSGREIMHIEAQGRFSGANSHLSYGENTLEAGDWNLTLQGRGWFEFGLHRFWLTEEVWERYGLVMPKSMAD